MAHVRPIPARRSMITRTDRNAPNYHDRCTLAQATTVRETHHPARRFTVDRCRGLSADTTVPAVDQPRTFHVRIRATFSNDYDLNAIRKARRQRFVELIIEILYSRWLTNNDNAAVNERYN